LPGKGFRWLDRGGKGGAGMANVVETLVSFGCVNSIVDLVGGLPEDVPLRVLESKATNYRALGAADGCQVAAYVHRNLINVALDPDEATDLAAVLQTRLIKKIPATWYVTVRGAHQRVRPALATALRRARDRAVTRADREGLHSLTAQASCPAHFLELPLTGLCDECD
jgi:hypothetical protein